MTGTDTERTAKRDRRDVEGTWTRHQKALQYQQDAKKTSQDTPARENVLVCSSCKLKKQSAANTRQEQRGLLVSLPHPQFLASLPYVGCSFLFLCIGHPELVDPVF